MTIAFQPEYNAIVKFYGDKRAERSGVLLINHIEEGLEILSLIGANMDAMRAYCLHPMIQDDWPLYDMSNNDILFSFSPRVVLLAMEYRQRANAWLSPKVYKNGVMTMKNQVMTPFICYDGWPWAGNLPEVRHMLIADKVQNYKDFLKYHAATHNRKEELDFYFKKWLEHLEIDTGSAGVGPNSFHWLCNQLEWNK